MIPKIIHQIWIGPKPIPDRERQWCAEMARMNPTWQHALHGNELLKRYAADAYVQTLETKARENPKNYAFLTDRLRVLLLRDEGGVYLDADCQPIRTLDSLPIWDRKEIDFAYGLRSPHRREVALHRSPVPLVDNTFIASAKAGRMINRLASLWNPSSVVINGHQTGIGILENTDHTTVVLNHRYFYAEQMFPETIALHDAHNLGSWTDKMAPNHAVNHAVA